jgi:uncharacterized membrane protein YtjA (UPF0391 family)
MLYWALLLLIIAIIAAILGFGGVAVAAVGIAKILFFIFLHCCPVNKRIDSTGYLFAKYRFWNRPG